MVSPAFIIELSRIEFIEALCQSEIVYLCVAQARSPAPWQLPLSHSAESLSSFVLGSIVNLASAATSCKAKMIVWLRSPHVAEEDFAGPRLMAEALLFRRLPHSPPHIKDYISCAICKLGCDVT